jgi:hypothetical protein
VEGTASADEVAFDAAAIEADRFDIAGFNFIQKFAEVEGLIGLPMTALDHGPEQDSHANQDDPEDDCF